MSELGMVGERWVKEISEAIWSQSFDVLGES